MFRKYRQNEVVLRQFVLVSRNVTVNEGDFVVAALNALLSAGRRKVLERNVRICWVENVDVLKILGRAYRFLTSRRLKEVFMFIAVAEVVGVLRETQNRCGNVEVQ